ncbi:hypothetical protein [Mesorhizobium sp.]|uniref:hypothetical protein n=1 Tax=Mesorhizobium sp. TaxID=1871066 RepID=UPI0025BA92B2|nr:hypothetical protein [Mesorhizobium sp.]
MPKTPKDKDQEKGDEVLRRLLKTPPDHKTGKGETAPKGEQEKTDPTDDDNN